MASFQEYSSRVKFGTSAGESISTAVVLPVDRLTIRAVPYTPEGGTVITLFRGERIFVDPTFGYEIELSWNNIREHSHRIQLALDKLIDSYIVDSAVNLYVQQTDTGYPGTYSATRVVPDIIANLDGEALSAIFEQRFRRKRATLRLVSRSQSHSLADVAWLTSDTA